MRTYRPFLKWLPWLSALLMVPVLGFMSPVAHAQGEETIYACYVPDVGAVYRIKEPGLSQACFDASHVEFSWDASALPSNLAHLDLAQTFTGTNTFTDPNNSFTGTFSGDGAGLTNIPTGVSGVTWKFSFQECPAETIEIEGAVHVTGNECEAVVYCPAGKSPLGGAWSYLVMGGGGSGARGYHPSPSLKVLVPTVWITGSRRVTTVDGDGWKVDLFNGGVDNVYWWPEVVCADVSP